MTQGQLPAWKAHLQEQGKAPATINAALSALNSFFRFLGWPFRARFIRIQRQSFRDANRELTRQEFHRLVAAAQKQKNQKLALILETICATGIRVSELRYITWEAVCQGQARIQLKGKVRVILLPNQLARKLKKYAKRQKITTGEIFLNRKGEPLSRRAIWAAMKSICKEAGVEESKVFPHNLRHLFAVAHYQTYKDIVSLADVLGHSSVDTTRLYLLTSGKEHQRQLDRLGLVS